MSILRKSIEWVVLKTTNAKDTGHGSLRFSEETDGDPEKEREEIPEKRIEEVVNEYETVLSRQVYLLLPFLSILLVIDISISWEAYSSFLTLIGAGIIFYYAIKGAGAVLDQSDSRLGPRGYSEPQMKALVRRNVSQGYGALLTFIGLFIRFILHLS